jgi:hypothetical protein
MCLSPIKHAATSERSDLNFFEGLAGPLLYRRFQAVPSTEARRASKKGLVRLGVDLLLWARVHGQFLAGFFYRPHASPSVRPGRSSL